MACRSCGDSFVQTKEQSKVIENSTPAKVIKIPEVIEQRDFIETIVRGSSLDLEIQKTNIDNIISTTKIAEGVYRILSTI